MASVTITATAYRTYCPRNASDGAGRYTVDNANVRVGMAAVNDWAAGTNYTENAAALRERYFRSLVWFDASPLAAIQADATISAVKLGYTAQNSGSADKVNVRVYRTDLAFDASKEFGQSAGTYWTEGITSAAPFNAHMPEYSEIAIGKGESAEAAPLCVGEVAQNLYTAVKAGYAAAFYVPYPAAAQVTASYGLRTLSPVSLTVEYIPKDTNVYAPSEAYVTPGQMTAGMNAKIIYANAAEGNHDANPITGYLVRYADRAENAEAYGDWSPATTYEQIALSGEIDVPVSSVVGTTRKYQIAARGQSSNSAYADVQGVVQAAAAPSILQATHSLRYCMLFLSLQVAASPIGEYMTIGYADSTGNSEYLRTVQKSGGSVAIARLLEPSAEPVTATITVYDAYGNAGAQEAFSVHPQLREVGRNYLVFNGISSAALGLLVSEYAAPDVAPARVENQKIVGRSGDIPVRQGETTADAYDVTPTLYVDDLAALPLLRGWLSGSGDVVFGLEPEYKMQASVDSGLSFSRMRPSLDGYELPVTLHCQPYRYRAQAETIDMTHGGTIVNTGDAEELPRITVYGSGDGTLTVNGQSLQLSGISGSCVIDCDAHVIRDANGIMSAFVGDVPTFAPGANAVNFSGQIEKISIERRERYR